MPVRCRHAVLVALAAAVEAAGVDAAAAEVAGAAAVADGRNPAGKSQIPNPKVQIPRRSRAFWDFFWLSAPSFRSRLPSGSISGSIERQPKIKDMRNLHVRS